MIKRLIPYFKGYGKYAVFSPLLVILETVCELLIPLQMARIVDVGIENMDMSDILSSGITMFLLAAVAMTCGIMAARSAAFASQGMGSNLRRAQFEKIVTFSFAERQSTPFSRQSAITSALLRRPLMPIISQREP